jgi:hypothetical protein
VSNKDRIIKSHLPHGVELHYTAHRERAAEFRCEGCNTHLCWASVEDLQTWRDLGAKLKPKVTPRDNIKVVATSGGNNEKKA